MSERVVVPSSRFKQWVDQDLRRFVGVMHYARKYWLAMTIGLLLIGVNIFYELYLANAQKVFLDRINANNLDDVVQFIKQSLAVAAIVVVLMTVQLLLKGLVQQYITRDMAIYVFGKINKLPLKKLQSKHSADWISRVTRDVPEAASIGNAVFDLTKDMLLIIFSFAYLSSFNIYLAAVALLSGPLIFAIGRLFDRAIRKLSERIQEREADARESLQEFFQGMPVIRAYELNRVFEQSFLDKKQRQNQDILKRDMMMTSMYQLMDLIINGIIIVVVYFVCMAVFRGEMTIGTVLAFIYLLIRVQVPFSNISRTLSHVQQGLGASDRIEAVLGMQSETFLDVSAAQALHAGNEDEQHALLRVSGLSFSYRDEEGNESPALTDIDLCVRSNETVAIVGMSGSGKSTLAKLICGLLEPDSGEVLLNGTSIAGRLDEARSLIGYIPQSSFMFSGTIRDNITMGLSGISDERLYEAAKLAGAHIFVDKLPERYDTPLSEASMTLSGGELQRLAIARAVLRSAPILIMDESTSALDNEMESYLEASMRTLAKDRAMIIIAHRMSTIMNADRIIVMDNGAIAAEGTHEQLMVECELYAKLYRGDHEHD